MRMAELIDRRRLKAETKDLLGGAQVSPKGFTALYLGLVTALNLADSAAGGGAPLPERGLLGIFVYVLVYLLGIVLAAGFTLYCMAVRRGERAEYLTLFDGFSFVGKVIGLNIVMSVFIMLWSMLFMIPGIIAAYRYRFALYNLYENPDLGILEALDMSKRQTPGYKGQLFLLDLSYYGWFLLAAAPNLVWMGSLYARQFEQALATGIVPEAVFSLTGSALVISLLCSLWSLAVALFYLPNYQCVELGYFDTAKRTSGVGQGVTPPESPDGLGGMDNWDGGL